MPSLSHKVEKTIGDIGLIKRLAICFDDGVKWGTNHFINVEQMIINFDMLSAIIKHQILSNIYGRLIIMIIILHEHGLFGSKPNSVSKVFNYSNLHVA